MMFDKVFDRQISWKKWSLLLLTIVGIIATLIISSVAIVIVDSLEDIDDTPERSCVESTRGAKNSAKIMILSSAIIIILIDLLAYFGGYQERYYMTLTFLMYMVMIGVGSVMIAIRTQCWYPTILHFFIMGLAFDLRIMRNRAFRPKHEEFCCEHRTGGLNVVSCQTYAPQMGCPQLELPMPEFIDKQPILPSYKESKKLP